MVKYPGPATFPRACNPLNSTLDSGHCPDPKNHIPYSQRFANGFRSVQCRCKQDPIVCQPWDEWVLITQYDNKLDVESTFEYTKVGNVP